MDCQKAKVSLISFKKVMSWKKSILTNPPNLQKEIK